MGENFQTTPPVVSWFVGSSVKSLWIIHSSPLPRQFLDSITVNPTKIQTNAAILCFNFKFPFFSNSKTSTDVLKDFLADGRLTAEKTTFHTTQPPISFPIIHRSIHRSTAFWRAPVEKTISRCMCRLIEKTLSQISPKHGKFMAKSLFQRGIIGTSIATLEGKYFRCGKLQ
jgi:hypothetical protein